MTTHEKPPSRRVLYGVIAALVLLLIFVALVAGRRVTVLRDAEEKADRLIAAVEEVGGRTPDRDQVVRVLGDDGGTVCADPTAALSRAAELAGMSNGAGGPGSRPVIADRDIVRAELLIVGIYCPDRLSEVTEFVDGLRTEDVAG